MRSSEEWQRQADYDLDTAEYMLRGGRHAYAVFMSHLALEKSLKGLYRTRLGKTPPKTHNLAYLLAQTGLQAPQATLEFLVRLNEAHIATRYPDDLAAMQAAYSEPLVRSILAQARETMAWIREQS